MAPAVPDPDAADLPPRGSDAADVAGNTWDLAPFAPPPAALRGGEVYIYRNVYNLVPRSIGECGRGGGLRALKFFGNDVEVLPPEAGDLDGLESLQVKVSSPRVSRAVLRWMRNSGSSSCPWCRPGHLRDPYWLRSPASSASPSSPSPTSPLGTSRTSLIVTVGPSARHYSETSSTVLFGQRVLCFPEVGRGRP